MLVMQQSNVQSPTLTAYNTSIRIRRMSAKTCRVIKKSAGSSYDTVQLEPAIRTGALRIIDTPCCYVTSLQCEAVTPARERGVMS